ncbi:MAG: HsdR family type I site-specific deoxyribonuclease, partial [Clostridia bacterium]|nr:HsdR family type I site-specific deoxyribonuclease [Clostridia bacterium]
MININQQNQYAEHFDDEAQFEKSFITLLTNCGWEKDIIKYPTEQDLINNWAQILYNNNRDIDKLGNYPLTNGEMKQIIEHITTCRTPFALNGFINGKTVAITRDNPADTLHYGKEVRLRIYDRLEIAGGRSRYQIVEQPKFEAKSSVFPPRRGDIMLLINGMPVFHIELKKTGIPISQAWNQIEKYSRENIFRGIFSLVQIFIAMTPEDAVYFTNPGPEGRFNHDFYFRWADFDNRPITDWRAFTQSLLYIPMAHQLIGFYTVADGKDGVLKVLRSYQYYAVSAISNRVAQNKWDEKNQRGGYIWHTTGSGKTLTSFKTADLISKSQDADKVVFLVDRKELDTQSVENYRYFADDSDEIQSTESTDILINALKPASQSSPESQYSLIVTSIQKLSRIYEDGSKKSQKDIEQINKNRIVFIVDECHRDTFGDMMSKVKTTFPNALFFGFTGTPIQEENKKKGCTSSDVFGKELHRYTIGDGIRDKNVLAFDPYMVETFKSMEIKSKIALEMVHATTEEEAIKDPVKSLKYYEILDTLQMAGYYNDTGDYIKGAEDYLPVSQYHTEEHISAVVNDILDKYERVSHGRKFHSIFATSSIPEAINYYRKLKGHLKATVLVDPSDDNENTNIEKIQGLAEIITDYNKRYGQNYSISSYGEMKKDISLRLSHEKAYKGIERTPEKQIDMLIVVNQMLTGFDSKWINVLYLDKLMKQENIIQAFSRTNRIFGSDKPVGLIYYYRYPHTMKRNIEDAVKMYSGDKAYMVFVDKLEKNLEVFNALYLEIKELFENENIEDFSHLPNDKAVKAKFASKFNELNKMLEMIKVQDFTWKQSVYGDTKVLITEQIYLTLLQRYKELTIRVPTEGGTYEEPPYDLDSHITEISTGKIDADYMNSRFDKYLKVKLDGESKKNIEMALQALYKSFAMLPEEEQKYAEIFIKDVQLGNLIPEGGKTFRDYITEYMRKAKDDQIHRFAETFGIDEAMLREIMSLHPTEETLNEYGKYDKIKNT